MAETSRERVGELLRALFVIVVKEPDGLPAKEAIQRLERSMTLTPYELGEFESGGRRFDKMLRFATVGTVKAGWLLKQKGRWFVTDEGRRALQKFPSGGEFRRESIRLYRQWKQSQPDDEDPEQEDTPVTATVTFEEAEERAWNEIQAHLRAIPPYEFQELVGEPWIAPPGKDGGVDILAATDPLGTRPPRIKVQVKRYTTGSIPVSDVRAFMALLGDDDVGLFVTTSTFSRDAQEEARGQERRRITLIDLERLIDLWVEHFPKLDETAKRRLPLKAIYFLAPDV